METIGLLRDSLNSNLQSRIMEIERQIEPLLDRTTNVNIDYTEHDIKHSNRIEIILSKCILQSYTILNDNEKFILVVSTLIHDVGMTGQGKYKDDPEYEKEIRDSHQSRSAEFVRKYGLQLGLNIREIEAIASISEGHRLLPLETYPEREAFGLGETIRPRLLAALLRFADELDILEERAPLLVAEYLEVNEESLLHHVTHQ